MSGSGSGTMIGGFELLQKIGEGGMGTVYKARQVSLDRIVALKILPPRFIKDEKDVERFKFESRAAAKLAHEGIVRIFEAGECEGHYYYAMDYVEGTNIAEWLKKSGALPAKDALVIALSVANALEYAWRTAGIIHRDIKPDNILVDKDGTIKLVDLGLVKVFGSASTLTMADEALGTPFYCSPEQAKGEQVDCRTDIYSLGAMLYHLVTGKLPFGECAGSGAMIKHVTERLPDPREVNPAVHSGMARLIARMMAKDAANRYSDWMEVITDIKLVEKGKLPKPSLSLGINSTVELKGTQQIAPIPVSSAPVSPKRASVVPARVTPRRKNPVPLIAMAVMTAIILVVGLTFAVLRTKEAQQPTIRKVSGTESEVVSSAKQPEKVGTTPRVTNDKAPETTPVRAHVEPPPRKTEAPASDTQVPGSGMMEAGKLVASDGGPMQYFGSSVAGDNEYVMAGAPGKEKDERATEKGAVYVFRRAGGKLTEAAKLTASDGTAGNLFGCSMDLLGDTAIVGAYRVQSYQGAAYVFQRDNAGNWTEKQKLIPSDARTWINFGISVAIDGDYTIVGANRAGKDQGQAYLFKREARDGKLVQKAILSDPQGKERCAFGCSVDICGEYAVVGDNAASPRGWMSGKALVYHREGDDGNWPLKTTLIPSNGGKMKKAGTSVSIDGEWIAIGSPSYDDKFEKGKGEVHIFRRTGDTWSEHQALTASDGWVGNCFGSSVKLRHDTLVVCAGSANAGSVYIFQRNGSDWKEAQKLIGRKGQAGNNFGCSACFTADGLIVGASRNDGKANDAGAIYVFAGVSGRTGE